MEYSCYLRMGNAYGEENNIFNAITSYEYILAKENKGYPVAALNIGHQFSKIGLYYHALHFTDLYFSVLKDDKSKNYYYECTPFQTPYINRLYINLRLEKFDLINEDLKELIKTSSEYFEIRGRYYLKIGDQMQAEIEFTQALKWASLTRENIAKKSYYYKLRSNFFEVTGNQQAQLKDAIACNEVNETKMYSLYFLGLTYFKINKQELSKSCLDEYRSKGGLLPDYEDAIYDYGIVLFLDRDKGFGFILGPTFFSSHDSIYFKISDSLDVIKKGQRVKYIKHYNVHKNKCVTFAKKITIDNSIENIKFKEHKIYHAILVSGKINLKTYWDTRYVELFYPLKAILPFDIIADSIDAKTKFELSKNNFVFVEIEMEVDANSCPIVKSVKLLRSENTYKNKKYRHSAQKLRQKTRLNTNYRSRSGCRVCGGDEWCGTGGCPLDPT